MPAAPWTRTARELCRRRSAILCYHGVAPASLSEDPTFQRVRPERFRAQVELLLEAGFELVTVAELAERAGGGEPPPGLAALSFDDGWDDNRSVVMPMLAEYGAPATVYVTTGLIGSPIPWMPEGTARGMTEDELREMAAAGHELGAHTVSHPDLSTLGYDDCLREMVESRDEVERIAGRPVRTFAYPFCHYGPAAVAAARDAGFEAAVTCQGRGSWERHTMKRALITAKDGEASFLLKLADAYQPLFDSVPGRALRAGTRGLRRGVRAARERAGGR
ncbi:MAG TPA: polysaccharide deacetylase family protein [Thermoleophilaceae bacterium]|jgi:peptidoglycan/xylan/chitin deacetylase (PgdA/CDA1 family)